MRQPIQVLVYPARMIEGSWEYLLLRRTAARGGFWQGVTGGLEAAEMIDDAARRELLEETGFRPPKIWRIGYSYRFGMADEWRHMYEDGVDEITEHVFVTRIDASAEPVMSAAEHDCWGWYSLEEAVEMLAWPPNIEALRRCDEFLRKRGAS